MTLYNITPKVPGEPTFPLTPEPVPLHNVGEILTARISGLKSQGYWRTCRGEKVPLNEIAFFIEPSNDDEY